MLMFDAHIEWYGRDTDRRISESFFFSAGGCRSLTRSVALLAAHVHIRSRPYAGSSAATVMLTRLGQDEICVGGSRGVGESRGPGKLGEHARRIRAQGSDDTEEQKIKIAEVFGKDAAYVWQY